MEITIGPCKVGEGHAPFFIAELSGNHNQSLDKALKLIDKAKEAGANAVKLQTYTADTITIKSDAEGFQINEQQSLWNKKNLHDLYSIASLPWSWHEKLFNRCQELDLICFSTPFDETAVDFLKNFSPPCYKIASPEIVDLPLIKKVAETKMPLIISTGAASFLEIATAVETAKKGGCREIILLKCTASYPAQAHDAHLLTMVHLAHSFQTLVGLSDHMLSNSAALASIALGATVIEKHLTLKRADGGVDSAFSLEPKEFASLVKEGKEVWQALGQIHYGPLESEKITHSHRPSLFFVEDLAAGETVELRHLKTLRPALGLPPSEMEAIIGLPLQKSISKGTPVLWDYFKK